MTVVKVPEGRTPLNELLDHPLLEVLREGARARDNGTGSPYAGHSLEHCLHGTGWVQRDLRLALDKLQGKALDPVPMKATKELSFSEALRALKHGKRVARAGWNGEGIWLTLVRAEDMTNTSQYGVIEMDDDYEDGAKYALLPWIGMKTADDKFVPWLCSQTDMLAEDWEIVQ